MQSFKKALAASLIFIVVTALISASLIIPFYRSEYMYYCDAELRGGLAGTLDYIFVGASNGFAAFVPPVADEVMGTNSYNLSGGLMTWYARRVLLEKELERNPVKTVAVEISYNSLWRQYRDAWGDSVFLSRLDTPAERAKFWLTNTSVKEWGNMYSNVLGSSIGYLSALVQNKILHKDVSLKNIDYALKNFHPKYESLQIPEAQRYKTGGEMDTYFVQRNVDELYAMIDLCKEKNIEVILVVVPISEHELFHFSNWNVMEEKWADLAKDTDCPMIDFNLLKNRFELFHDPESFADEVHMSKTGAEVFTAEYGKVMNMYKNGEDISDLFYSNYAEMKQDSDYLQNVG